MLRSSIQAQTLKCLSGSPPLPSYKSTPTTARSAMSSSVVRIAVVGDVHDDWNAQEDAKALQILQPDLVLFTGDFGNENVELVRNVAGLESSKAVILGNHDAWKTHNFSGNVRNKDPVQLQLDCLREKRADVGYGRLDFPTLKLSVVGGRPFSCGGKHIFRGKLVAARYGIEDMDQSAKRIYKVASGTPEDHLVIILAHNGPTGLGSEFNDICGKDWVPEHGDHGDPDLAQAISLIKENTRSCIPLVVFGHMHKRLSKGQGLRKMIVVGDDNTIYLNGAVVPRVRKLIDEEGNSGKSLVDNETSSTTRAFTLVEMLDGRVEKIAENWVAVVGDTATLQEEHLLFKYGS